jgi:hypothetical protein
MTKKNTPTAEATADDVFNTAAEAQAKADAEAAEAKAAAQVAAKAEELAQAEAAEAAAAAQAAEKAALEALAAPSPVPELNVQALTYAARQIDMLNTAGHRLGLVDELTQLYDMEIVEGESGVTIACEGVSIDPADTVETALTNWANAARRACLGAAA